MVSRTKPLTADKVAGKLRLAFNVGMTTLSAPRWLVFKFNSCWPVRPLVGRILTTPRVLHQRRPDGYLFLLCSSCHAMLDCIMDPLPRDARKGRGAPSNRTGRFEALLRVAADDGWGSLEEEPDKLRTTVTADTSRTVITRNESPDLGFDRSINPYRGCEHGCAYCYARPTHAFLGLSPGQDFESKIFAKPDAPALLRQELAKPGYQCRMIALGTNTDPYQPVEREHRITRQILEVLAAHDHPVGIVTKSALVARDLDILGPMARRGLAKVAISVTTLDRKLANKLEPRASTPDRRLGAIRDLVRAGVPTGVMVAPLIAALTDTEIESILLAASKAGATEAGYVLLRLPLEVRELFEEWLSVHAPLKASRVMTLVRDTRGGKTYDARFGVRQRGTGPYAELIAHRFAAAIKRYGLSTEKTPLHITRFHVPGPQLSLL
jgi:DNA repair photolyase